MIPFHNNHAIKEIYVTKLISQIDLSTFNSELGWPFWLGQIAHNICNGLPKEEAEEFSCILINNIKSNIDFDSFKWKLAILRHTKQVEMLTNINLLCVKECVESINKVIKYCEINLNDPNDSNIDSLRYEAQQATLFAAKNAWNTEITSYEMKELIKISAISVESAAHTLKSLHIKTLSPSRQSISFFSLDVNYWRKERDMLLSIFEEFK